MYFEIANFFQVDTGSPFFFAVNAAGHTASAGDHSSGSEYAVIALHRRGHFGRVSTYRIKLRYVRVEKKPPTGGGVCRQ